MVFQPTGPGPRTARVKIVQSKQGRLPLGDAQRGWSTHGLKWFGLIKSIDAQRDAVSTYGRDIEITDEKGITDGVRYIA